MTDAVIQEESVFIRAHSRFLMTHAPLLHITMQPKVLEIKTIYQTVETRGAPPTYSHVRIQTYTHTYAYILKLRITLSNTEEEITVRNK